MSTTRPRSGVALILVLGVLSALMALVVAFSVFMRAQRLAAWSHVGQVQADQLVHVALARAVEDIDSGMAGYCYPYWGNRGPSFAADAMASMGVIPCSNIFGGNASNMIPAALWQDAVSAGTNCGWIPIVSGGITNGRVAYLVVNCSGLLDANRVGGATRQYSTNVAELDLSGLPEMSDTNALNAFLSDRTNHRRYETVCELGALNSGIARPVSNFFVYSYDPDRDVYFTGTNRLGRRDIELLRKFPVNNISGFAGYASGSSDSSVYTSNTNFGPTYWAPLTNLLGQAGLTKNPAAVAWNLVNYLDGDRIPVCEDSCPWRAESGSEAVPLINEIVLREIPLGGTNREYRFVVELWFPFFPAVVGPTDGFALQVGVFADDVSGIDESDVMDHANPAWSFTNGIPGMEFGAGSEFLCCTSPPIAFFGNTKIGENPGFTNRIYFLARVLQDGTPVDEAMGYDCDDPPGGERRLKEFTNAASYSANDPRLNGRTTLWVEAPDTLGATNSICDPWSNGGQGLPIFHRDGLMPNIGEIGHVFLSDTNGPWRNISLTSYDGGAALLDFMTVRPGNPDMPVRGLVNVCGQQYEPIRALFHNSAIGLLNSGVTTNRLLDAQDIYVLAGAIDRAGMNFRTALGNVGADTNFAAWMPDGVHTSGDLKEDAFRNIVELITFRQNLFAVVLAAQALAKDGLTMIAEQRAVAIVYRDAYTGKVFVRSMMSLTN